MHCIRRITEDLVWVGANDRRLALFEGVYSVPYGVSYNSYLLSDEKTVLFDTVDWAVHRRFIENLEEALGSRELDYLIIQHMEPDHSAGIKDLLLRYPKTIVICNAKTAEFIGQFFDIDISSRINIVGEGDTLSIGKHVLTFINAPMVHWPEVMVTYDATDKILFSADAFGCFGALNGALFADEVDFAHDYMDEARRYYTNIVGKYGAQVGMLFKKASALEIETICPLHGFVWRRDLDDIISKYLLWSSYIPEEQGVLIAYASVYGNTENAAEILSCILRTMGIKTMMFDVSVIPVSEVIAAAFRMSHLVFASTTYNAGIFVTMDALLSELTAHNIGNRTVAFIENGTWAATSGSLMRDKFSKCKDIRFIENTVSIKSSVKQEQIDQINSMATAISKSFPKENEEAIGSIDRATIRKISYGLFILSVKDGIKDTGCITNTVTQITESPQRLSVALNKTGYTHDVLMRSKEFNVSILTEKAPFNVFERFGFTSGRDIDKFDGYDETYTSNGIRYIPEYSNAVISAKVIKTLDYDSHTVFIADVVEAKILSEDSSVTYSYYLENIKPKKKKADSKDIKKGFECRICGYIYEGETIPDDFICPICKHGKEYFEKII